jgi:hypothetical protein
VKYDDASWHSGGNFPDDLPAQNGATHIAMFVVWCWSNGLEGPGLEAVPEARAWLKTRSLTPNQIFFRVCGGKFWDQDLNELGNAFAKNYYCDEKTQRLGAYIDDYADQFSLELPTLYHAPSDWTTYDRIAPVIAKRFLRFKNTNV